MAEHEHSMTYNPMSAPTDELIDSELGKLEKGITHLILRHDHEHDGPHHHAPEDFTGTAKNTAPEDSKQGKRAGLWW